MVVVYSINCPACKILEKKLINAEIPYRVILDEEIHKNLGIEIFPMMSLDNSVSSINDLIDYGEARKWIDNEVKKKKDGSN